MDIIPHPTMNSRRNRRGRKEYFVKSWHLKLNDLKEEALRSRATKTYINKGNIPEYPGPEFEVRHLKHDTDGNGLRGIRRDNGFRGLHEGLLWWSLSVGPDDITSAERRLLEKTYPDRTKEQVQRQQSFLEKFATSPAFMGSSRLGSYRFTFPLEEVLEAYREQCCSGAQPVMRVFKTVLYKQEVMYVVLVHSPANQEQFSEYPLLTDDPNSVCAYRDGCFIWRPEAMCGTHRYKCVLRPDEMQFEVQEVLYPQFYVWDHVVIALHVDRQVLNFDAGRLRENLKLCERGEATVSRPHTFVDFSHAAKVVKFLWPLYPSPLEC